MIKCTWSPPYMSLQMTDGINTLELKFDGDECLESMEYPDEYWLWSLLDSLVLESSNLADVEPGPGVLCSSNLLRYENETRSMTMTRSIVVTRAPRMIASTSFLSSVLFLCRVSASCLMGSSLVTTGTWRASLIPNLFLICTATV